MEAADARSRHRENGARLETSSARDFHRSRQYKCQTPLARFLHAVRGTAPVRQAQLSGLRIPHSRPAATTPAPRDSAMIRSSVPSPELSWRCNFVDGNSPTCPSTRSWRRVLWEPAAPCVLSDGRWRPAAPAKTGPLRETRPRLPHLLAAKQALSVWFESKAASRLVQCRWRDRQRIM